MHPQVLQGSEQRHLLRVGAGPGPPLTSLLSPHHQPELLTVHQPTGHGLGADPGGHGPAQESTQPETPRVQLPLSELRKCDQPGEATSSQRCWEFSLRNSGQSFQRVSLAGATSHPATAAATRGSGLGRGRPLTRSRADISSTRLSAPLRSSQARPRLPRFCLEHKLVSRGFPTLSRTGSLPGSPHRLQASLRCAHPFLQPPSGLSGPPLTVAQVTTPPGAALLPPKVCPDRALTPKGSTQGDRVPGWGMHCRQPPPWPSPFPAQPRTFCACYGCYSRGPGLCSQEWGT